MRIYRSTVDICHTDEASFETVSAINIADSMLTSVRRAVSASTGSNTVASACRRRAATVRETSRCLWSAAVAARPTDTKT